MRTIYTTGGCVAAPFKIQLDDQAIGKIIRIKELLVAGEVDTATIGIQSYNPEKHFNWAGRAYWTEAQQRTARGTYVILPRGLPKVELGHECEEEFWPATEGDNILDLHDVSFESEYLNSYLRGGSKIRPWEILEPEHELLMMPHLRDVAREALRKSRGLENLDQSESRARRYWGDVLIMTNGVINKKRVTDELFDLCRDEIARENDSRNLQDSYPRSSERI